MKKKNRGSILIMVVIFMVILTIVGVSYIQITERERIYALEMIGNKDAFYIAESGLQRAKAWLMTYDKSPEQVYGIYSFDPFAGWNGVGTSPGTYKVSIDPADDNAWKYDKEYNIVSTGTAHQLTKVLKETVKISNYNRYAYFSNSEDVASGRKYFHHLENFDGWVHSNDEVSIYGFVGFSTYSAIPMLYELSTSDDFFFNDTGYSDGGGLDMTLLSSNYPPADPVDMYKNWDLKRIKDNAQLPLTGKYAISIGDNYINYVNIDSGLSDNWAIPAGGGIVYADSNIKVRSAPGLTFTNKWLTIASPATIMINDDINYNAFSPGMIGLVAGTDIVVALDTPEDSVNIDSCMVAYSRFRAMNSTEPFTSPRPSITVYGCIIQNTRGPIGEAPVSYSTYVPAGYYFNNVKYDSRLLEFPPPQFPKYVESETVYWDEEPTKRGTP